MSTVPANANLDLVSPEKECRSSSEGPLSRHRDFVVVVYSARAIR